MPQAVIFDFDGVLMDSEQRWNEAKEPLVREAGGEWRAEAPTVMMGMSSPEWSAYVRDDLGVAMDAAAISRDVVRRGVLAAAMVLRAGVERGDDDLGAILPGVIVCGVGTTIFVVGVTIRCGRPAQPVGTRVPARRAAGALRSRSDRHRRRRHRRSADRQRRAVR